MGDRASGASAGTGSGGHDRDAPGPAPAWPAATLVLVREATSGLEALLLRRNHRAGFAPGAYVFPGGRVDATDAASGVLALVDNLTPEAAAARLDLEDGDPPAIAYYVAALREAFEETGIPVAFDRRGSPPASAAVDPAVDRLRDHLMEDRIAFDEVLAHLDSRVDASRIRYLAHWVTPASSPRRFDTRFFAAEAPGGAEPIVDSREMTEAVWIAPALAVEQHERGRLPMIAPTLATLKQLTDYASPRHLLEALPLLVVTRILPVVDSASSGAGPSSPSRG